MRRPFLPPMLRGPLSVVLALGGVLGLAAAGACFNSDDKFVEEDPGTTTGETYGENPTTTDVGDESTTGEEPEADCEDAIDCIVGCAGELQEEDFNPEEPDLSCFINCEEGLTTEEALELLRLAECLTAQCVLSGACNPLEETTGGEESTGGSETGVDTDTTGDTDTDTDTDGGPEFPCLECVATLVQDPEPPGCMAEASACRN